MVRMLAPGGTLGSGRNMALAAGQCRWWQVDASRKMMPAARLGTLGVAESYVALRYYIGPAGSQKTGGSRPGSPEPNLFPANRPNSSRYGESNRPVWSDI